MMFRHRMTALSLSPWRFHHACEDDIINEPQAYHADAHTHIAAVQ